MAKKKKNLDISNLDFSGIQNPNSQNMDMTNPAVENTTLTSEQIEQVQKEIDKEEQFGDRPVSAAVAGAARGLTFGISDQVLVKSGLIDEVTLREIEERNKAASLGGEILGVAAPLVATAGTAAPAVGAGTAARGAAAGIRVAGTGVRAAARAGEFAEIITAKALKKVIEDTGKKKFAQEVIKKAIPRAAGSAVEGTFYGAGKLISEEALGRAEINAENVASAAGAGALFGAAGGGIFGAAEALVPIVKNSKIVDYAVKKLKPADDNINAWKLSGKSTAQIAKLKEKNPTIYENASDYIKRRNVLKVTDNTETFFKNVNDDVANLGKEIGKTLNKVDDQIKINPNLAPTKHDIGIAIRDRLTTLKESFKGVPLQESKKAINRINKDIKNVENTLIKSRDKISGTELHELKLKFQEQAKWDKKGILPLNEKIARESSRAVRDKLLELADNVSIADNQLGKQLRQQNVDYGTATELLSTLESKAIKESERSLLDLKDGILAGLSTATGIPGLGAAVIATKKFAESDFRRKLSILSDVEKRIQTVGNKIDKTISNFESKKLRVLPITSTKILLDSHISRKLETPSVKPKDKVEAITNIRQNLETLETNPELMVKKSIVATKRLENAAPNIAQNVNMIFNRALGFLKEKVPAPITAPGTLTLIKKEYKPSTSEISKFERYLHAIENPLEALEQMESGRLSREAVEAIKTVYPEMYAEIQEKAMASIAENPEKYDYNKRLQIGVLLDIPADSSLLPQNILELQKQFNIAEQEREQEIADNRAAVNTTVGGINKIDKADRAQAQSERTITRK